MKDFFEVVSGHGSDSSDYCMLDAHEHHFNGRLSGQPELVGLMWQHFYREMTKTTHSPGLLRCPKWPIARSKMIIFTFWFSFNLFVIIVAGVQSCPQLHYDVAKRASADKFVEVTLKCTDVLATRCLMQHTDSLLVSSFQSASESVFAQTPTDQV